MRKHDGAPGGDAPGGTSATPPSPQPAPLILTLMMDPASQAALDALRRAHFPADRLVVGAHLTLFHALPAVDAVALAAQAQAQPVFQARISGLRFLGRGVAYTVHAPALTALRATLRARWATGLGAQDRQPWQPHVTIQNKVEPATARDLFQRLSRAFVPWDITALGLALWHYRGGPWEEAGQFPFTPPAGAVPNPSPRQPVA